MLLLWLYLNIVVIVQRTLTLKGIQFDVENTWLFSFKFCNIFFTWELLVYRLLLILKITTFRKQSPQIVLEQVFYRWFRLAAMEMGKIVVGFSGFLSFTNLAILLLLQGLIWLKMAKFSKAHDFKEGFKYKGLSSVLLIQIWFAA